MNLEELSRKVKENISLTAEEDIFYTMSVFGCTEEEARHILYISENYEVPGVLID